MITCPSCNHPNPDEALNCEACFTPLPIVKTVQCPSCNTSVLSDAKFCGHCGFNLSNPSTDAIEVNQMTEDNPAVIIEPMSELPNVPDFTGIENMMAAEAQNLSSSEPDETPVTQTTRVPASHAPISVNAKTQLQQFIASLLHVQTNLNIEIPVNLPVVHIGKPNAVIPPDIDVSGFPDSDIVSRIHADIRAEGDAFYLEDTGSSNGTYINNLPLPVGNRHKLRAGDRISLGKGDKVSFIFQFNS